MLALVIALLGFAEASSIARTYAALERRPWNADREFGTARSLEDRFLDLLATHPEARRLVVRLDRLGRIDLTGAQALKALLDDARGAGLVVSVEGSPAHASRILGRVLDRR